MTWASPIPLPRGDVNPLHLYRHLLRETSYLPPAVAPYIASRIRQRFAEASTSLDQTKTGSRLRTGRRELRRLQAANAGSLDHMHRLFLHAFGRLGKTRRELTRQLTTPPAPLGSKAYRNLRRSLEGDEAEAEEVYRHARTNRRYASNFLDTWDFIGLERYLRSQAKHSDKTASVVWRVDPPRFVDPRAKIPKTNVWGRKTPILELRTRLKHFWMETIPKIVPPMAKSQWDTIRELATNGSSSPLLSVPPRRAVAAPVDSNVDVEGEGGGEGEAKPWAWKTYASLRAEHIEGDRKRGYQDSAKGMDYEEVRPVLRTLRRRQLRRICEKVFETSSYTVPNEKQGTPSIVWGKLVPDFPVATPVQSSFFEGYEESGAKRRPRPDPSQRRDKPRDGKKRERKASSDGVHTSERDKTAAQTPPPNALNKSEGEKRRPQNSSPEV